MEHKQHAKNLAFQVYLTYIGIFENRKSREITFRKYRSKFILSTLSFLTEYYFIKKGTFHFCKKFSEVSEVSVILGNSWGMKVKGIVKDSQIYKRWILNTKYTVPFLTGVVHFQSSGREALLHLTSGQRITCDQVNLSREVKLLKKKRKEKKEKKGNF